MMLQIASCTAPAFNTRRSSTSNSDCVSTKVMNEPGWLPRWFAPKYVSCG